MLIDTHAHLDYEVFLPDFGDVLTRAKASGVERVITIGTGCESSRRAVQLAEKYEEVFATVGVHPNQVEAEPDDYLEQLRKLASHPRVVAIGEIGLDYFRLPGGPDCSDARALPQEKQERRDTIIRKQRAVFEELLELAEETGLNAVIHQRSSWEDTAEILRRWGGRVRGVLHCFGGTAEEARAMIELGHLVSFTGIATFKNGQNMRDCAAALRAGEFMVETDAPYLAPEPHRGSRCEPWHTRLVAERLAAARGETLESLAGHTTRTAEQFFRFTPNQEPQRVQ